MRRPGGTSLAEAPRPSAPAPPTQLGSSDPSPHILQSEAHTGPLAQTAQPLGPAVDMQQLQSNLLRPATPTAARLQAAAEGQSEQQGGRPAHLQGYLCLSSCMQEVGLHTELQAG